MSRWLILTAVVLLAVLGVGAYSSFRAAVPVQAARAERGEVRQFVDERGKTRLPEIHLITTPLTGRIDAITLDAGEPVAAGQVVAQISPQDLADAVAEARAAVERLEASLVENDDTSVEDTTKQQAELLANSMQSTVAAAQAKLQADRSRVDYAETFLGRIRKLIETGSQSEDDLDKAELSYIESEVAYRQNALTVEALKTIQAATDLLPKIAGQYIDRKSLTHAVLEKQRQEAQARLRQALLQQERGEMKSPVDGVVLERLVRDEQYLPAGTLLLRIGQLERLEVEADVLSEDAVRIGKGAAAEIYGPAIGAEAGGGAAAVVHRVHPAGFTKISSLGVEQQRVTVILRFAAGELERLRKQQNIGVDYRVRVRIFTDQQRDAVVVPRAAVFRGSDRGWAVFAIRDGRAELQPIEVRLMNDEQVAVASGLAAGDQVVLAPESGLEHGARVKLAE